MSEYRCSFCGKLSPALHMTRTHGASSLLICEACARSAVEAIERKKVGSGVPQPSLDFTKETAGTVLGEECRRLAAEATTLCEQLVGDILWGGGLAQERVAHRIRQIQLLWLCRARLASIMKLARASKFDAVPDLVEQANAIRVDSVEKLGDCADAQRVIKKVEEQVRLLQAMASLKHRVTIRPLEEDQGSLLPAATRSKRLREIP